MPKRRDWPRPAAGTLSKRPTLLYHSIVTACLSTKIPIPRKKVGILAWSIPSWSTNKIYKQIDSFKGDETKELFQSPMQFKFLVIRSQNRVFPRLSFPISLVLLPHQELKAVQDEMAHPGFKNPSTPGQTRAWPKSHSSPLSRLLAERWKN